jgi:hypothetical protein
MIKTPPIVGTPCLALCARRGDALRGRSNRLADLQAINLRMTNSERRESTNAVTACVARKVT